MNDATKKTPRTLSLKTRPAADTAHTSDKKPKKPLRGENKHTGRTPSKTHASARPAQRDIETSREAYPKARPKPHAKAPSKAAHKPHARPERNSRAPAPAMEPTATIETAPRMDLSKIHVYRLPASGLAHQITLAAHLLMAVGHGYSLQMLLAQIPIDEVARPNVQRLVFDALRHWGTTRFWLQKYINQPPAEWIQAVLSVALTQLLLQEENEFTLVNEAVIAIDNQKPHAKGMVNAILRRFLRERDEWMAAAQTDEVARFNHPQWWIDLLKTQYPHDWERILTVNNSHPPMTLRVNARQYTREQYQNQLTAHGHTSTTSELSEQALVLDQPCSVHELPNFAAGAVSVQDAGAQLSAALLDLRAGQRVLDACAAPGGKTAHALELHPDIAMTALEKDGARAQRIHDNLARLDLSAQVIVNDANRVHEWWDGVPFERVLLDAPCSASGIVRRHPDIRWLRQADDLAGLAQQQAQLLRTMWQVLAVGGRLVYCTCSIFTTECAGIIEAFMQHTPNARRIKPEILTALTTPEQRGQLLPNVTVGRNHDGFFYAVLEKTAAPV